MIFLLSSLRSRSSSSSGIISSTTTTTRRNVLRRAVVVAAAASPAAVAVPFTFAAVTMATSAGASSSSGSLSGLPIRHLVPPGRCQLGETPVPCKLIQRWDVSPTSSVLRFELPDKSQPLNLSTCACILAKIDQHRQDKNNKKEEEGETASAVPIVRPYTPISTNDLNGCFDLLVKKYDNGIMSSHLHSMKVNHNEDTDEDNEDYEDIVKFFHIEKNVKLQASQFLNNQYDTIVMIAGGTGITPMIQALHAILGDRGGSTGNGNDDDETTRKTPPKVILLYGSRTYDDILGRELLDRWALEYSTTNKNQFRCVHVLSDEPDNDRYDIEDNVEFGYVDEERIRKYVPPPPTPDGSSSSSNDERICIFVCGPPIMYDVLCGPRDETDSVKGILGKLGYRPEQVYKF